MRSTAAAANSQGGNFHQLYQENIMGLLVAGSAAAGTASGLISIGAGMAANEALSAAEMAAQIQKKANTAAVNAI
ncbi:hypothetical protein HF313_16575 [Massilia atriviolacea]|uniref:hypothetical protein n=2 Tax=Massilia atriviolacea TaxID=2495579 RepID=UPI000F7EE5BD|nr:hypothetical protein [Massilia atriviolacea]